MDDETLYPSARATAAAATESRSGGIDAAAGLRRDALLLGVCAIVKTLFVQWLLELDVGVGPSVWFGGWLGIVVAGLVWAVPHRMGRWPLVLAHAILSLGLFGDLLFHRAFHDLPGWSSLASLGQVAQVRASMTRLTFAWDLLLFADLPVAGWLAVPRERLSPQPARPLLWSAAGLVVIFLSVATFGASRSALLGGGLVAFHARDAAEQLMRSAQAPPRGALLRVPRTPSPLFGTATGANVIVLQLEAMQHFLLDARVDGVEVTPNLNRLATESLRFDDFYPQIGHGNTSDAEFLVLNGLHPIVQGAVGVRFGDRRYRGLPDALKRHGYRRAEAFHAFDATMWNRDRSFPAFGFDAYRSLNDFVFDEAFGMGLTDRSFYRQTLPRLAALPRPFFAMLVSLSGHHPYEIPQELRALKPADGRFSAVFRDYLEAQHYADAAFGEWLHGLSASGLLEDSLLVVYGDHFGIGWEPADVRRLRGVGDAEQTPADVIEAQRVPLLIRLPHGRHAGPVEATGGQVDVSATIAGLVGLPDDALCGLGRDLLREPDGVVALRTGGLQGAFVSREQLFVPGPGGEFSSGKCFRRAERRAAEPEACRAGHLEALRRLEVSDAVLWSDGLAEACSP